MRTTAQTASRAAHRVRCLAALALLGALVVPVTVAHATEPATPSFESLVDPGDMGADGHEAVVALGDQLDDVAAAHHMSAAELADELLTDHTLQVDAQDRLIYVEDPAPTAELAADALAAATPADGNGYTGASSVLNLTDAQVFDLSSRPDSPRTLYLDFTGHTTTGTYWNTTSGVDPIVTTAYSYDADATTFTQYERNQMATAWANVAEAYAAFDVNVTTKDPGIEALRKTSTGDTTYGIRVVVGPNSGWSQPSGGVAYLGSFNWNSDTPAFVFSSSLANFGKYMGDAAAHEAGHSFGMHHDGTVAGAGGTPAASGYYRGQGNWAPIMGVGYDRPVVQWSTGEYALANNTGENDVAMIAAMAPYVADTEGSPAAPVALPSLPTSTGGVIANRSDVDAFSFQTGGTFQVDLTLRAPNPMLDASVTVKDGSGAVVATANPNGVGAVTVSHTGPQGTYTVELDGVGYLSPATTGYSDYSSIGAYWLAVTGTNPVAAPPPAPEPPPAEAPVAEVVASATTATAPAVITFDGTASTDPAGSSLTYKWNFGDGTTSDAPAPAKTYSAVGTYTVALTVTNTLALTSTRSLQVSIKANQAPKIVATASTTTGFPTLKVQFGTAGTADPEGGAVTYAWTFGDGTTSTAAAPLKGYVTPGTYTARVTAKDAAGTTATKAFTITVKTPVKATTSLKLVKVTGARRGVATVTVTDSRGRVVRGAKVTGYWRGVVTATTATIATNTYGKVAFTSPTAAAGGTLKFIVAKVVMPTGWAWDGTTKSLSIAV